MYLGDYPTGALIDHKFSSQAADGSAITLGTDGSIRIYKNNSTTQRASSNGITFTEDFDDPVTGVHHLRIDAGDNSDAGFYAAGNEYQVVLVGAVVDGITVNTPLVHFSIERAGGALALIKALSLADPWLTALPGAYGAGTAGQILGDRIMASVTGAVGTVTDKAGYRLSSTGVDDILRTALPESYAADGAAGTLTQILYLVQQLLSERSISSTTLTVKKLDGSTTAATFTTNSATNPTSYSRTT